MNERTVKYKNIRKITIANIAEVLISQEGVQPMARAVQGVGE